MERDGLLATDARLVGQEGALGALDVVRVTVVIDARMSACRDFGALKPTLGRPCAARLGRLQNRLAAAAANLLKNGLGAACAEAAVAHLLTVVLPALEELPTGPDANVLGLELRHGTLLPPLGRLPLRSLLLSRAAVFSALVASAVQVCLADP